MTFKTSCIVSHVHYNNVHAFRCVFYFVAMLSAGRFGLGWAHDEFIFACYMFMHSHAYVPSILYILIYLLLGTFLIVSLSFSPSYVNCVMAPKRKSTLFRNPLRSGGIFFFFSIWPHPLSCLVPWWEGQIGLLGEFFMTLHSFETPSRSVRFLWHRPTHCHP